MAATSIERRSVPVALNLCLLNWLVPGAGFIAAGDIRRGLTLLVIINAVFFSGILWGGYVLRPPFSPSAPDFNVVAALTYIVQAFHGGGWLLLQFLHGRAAESPEAAFNLIRMAARPFSDLGFFHLVVGGGLNYFATVRLYDLLAGSPALTQSIPNSEASKEITEGSEA